MAIVINSLLCLVITCKAQEVDDGDDFASVYILYYFLDERYALLISKLQSVFAMQVKYATAGTT